MCPRERSHVGCAVLRETLDPPNVSSLFCTIIGKSSPPRTSSSFRPSRSVCSFASSSSVTVAGVSCTLTLRPIRPPVGSFSSCARPSPMNRLPGFSSSTATPRMVWRFRSPCAPWPSVRCVRTSFRSPWHGVAERRIESCRRDLLDHVIPLDERHLKRLLSAYV
jgi:hypothetical protein